jgi:hypothetical protein
MAQFKVDLDHTGMRELLRSPGVQDEMHRRAEKVAAAARHIAPVGPDSRTGDVGTYRDSIDVEDDPNSGRARAKVVARDWKAHIIEAEHRVLGRALDAAGD